MWESALLVNDYGKKSSAATVQGDGVADIMSRLSPHPSDSSAFALLDFRRDMGSAQSHSPLWHAVPGPKPRPKRADFVAMAGIEYPLRTY
jgi:hypothetical protein